jgi:hypothetical protein
VGIADLRDESDRHGFSGNFMALWKSINNNKDNNNSNKINAESFTTLTPLIPQRFTLRQALDEYFGPYNSFYP